MVEDDDPWAGFQSPRQCRTLWGKPKAVFRTEADATAHINGGPGMNAYYCRHCSNYHVGHVPGTRFGSRPATSKRQVRRALRRSRRGVDD